MRVALICYHANINEIYKPEWVEQFRYSVLNQTYKDFIIYEINYAGGEERIFENSIYESKKLPTFIDAMNYLISKALVNGAEIVANLNADDVYSLERLQVQIPYIEIGFDVVSSNFSLMKDGVIFHEHHFENKNIKHELEIDHNVICHPVVLANKAYWEANKYVPEECPYEDLLLWKRSVNDFKFVIAPENLLTQRIHNNSVCKSENR